MEVDRQKMLRTAFNRYMEDFFNDLAIIFPDNADIKMGYVSFKTLIKMNTRALIKLWYTYSYDYHEQINNGNIKYFLEKDYSHDIKKMGYCGSGEEVIDRLQGPINSLEDSNKDKAMKYIQNLTKISIEYMKQ